jgi:hypothetical protein
MNRRHVVEGLLLGALVGKAAIGKSWSGRQIVVFDTRFAAARRFSAEVAPGSWLAYGISGDVTPLWHELLEAEWQRHGATMHGMTTAHSFYGLEQLVADQFWRTTSLVPAGDLVKWQMAPRRIAS